MYNNNLIIKFLEKYFFILKAASDGWRITYNGGNKFCFHKSIEEISAKELLSKENFIQRYKVVY